MKKVKTNMNKQLEDKILLFQQSLANKAKKHFASN